MRVNFLTRYDPIRERPLNSLPCSMKSQEKCNFSNDSPSQLKASFSQHDNFNGRSTSISRYGIESRKWLICSASEKIFRRIGRHLGRSDMVVARCWQQWITEGRVYRRGGSGRPRNTNDREDRAIRRVATSAPTTSLASIQRHLPPSRHPVPSRETIRRRLTEVGVEGADVR
ncbi:hypothetical protein TNCV_1523261 [Trichonephila clavipes]|nr:hypothetical protein TNCV_1523261 [Trichonephila clavipes]